MSEEKQTDTGVGITKEKACTPSKNEAQAKPKNDNDSTTNSQKTKRISKGERCWNYMVMTGKGLTRSDAFEMFGTHRLVQYVHEWRKDERNVIGVPEEKPDRYGTICRYYRYFVVSNGDGKGGKK